jgi:hypothetical protein
MLENAAQLPVDAVSDRNFWSMALGDLLLSVGYLHVIEGSMLILASRKSSLFAIA